MAATLSQHVIKLSGGNNVTSSAPWVMTLGSATVGGEVCVVFVEHDRNPTTSTVSGLGATWTRLAHVDSTPDLGAWLELWIGVGCTSGNTTVSVSVTNATFPNTCLQLWTGVGGDVIASAMSAATTSTTPITPDVSSSLSSGQAVAGFFMQFNNSTGYTGYTDTQGAWTVDDDSFDSFTASRIHSAHRIPAETGSQRHEGDGFATAREWVTAAVVFGDAPAGGGSSPRSAPVHARRNVALMRSAVI